MLGSEVLIKFAGQFTQKKPIGLDFGKQVRFLFQMIGQLHGEQGSERDAFGS